VKWINKIGITICFVLMGVGYSSISNAQTPVSYPNFCSESTIDLSSVLGTTGRTFRWTTSAAAVTISGSTINTGTSPFLTTITQKLTLIGNAPGNITYNIVADDNSKFTLLVTVLPLPSISNVGSWTSVGCGNNINFNPTSNIPLKADGWSWIRAATLGTAAISGTSNLITDNLINTTALSVNVPYVVAMAATNGCSYTQTLAYTISPTPIISDPIKYDTLGNGNPISFTPKTQLTSSVFTWASPATTGLTNQTAGTRLSNFNQTPTNTTPNAVNTVYNISPSFQYTTFTCTGPTFQVFITVNPNGSTNFCSGSSSDLSAALGVSAARTFKWTVGTVSSTVTGYSNGTTLSPTIKQPLILSGTTTGTVNYTVTDDQGTKYTLVVSVLPSPTISNAISTWNPISVGCGNNINFTAASTIALNSDGWSWSRAAILGIAATSGTSNLINDNLIDTTKASVSVPYLVTMVAQNGCTNTQTLTYSISPTPIISDAVRYDTICSGNPISFTPKTQSTGSLFTWANPFTAGLTGGTAVAIATKITNFNQTLANTTASAINSVYNIAPNYQYTGFACTGPTFQVFVTVNPRPSIPSPVNLTTCSGTPFKTSPVTGGATIVPTITQYTWTAPQYSDTSLSGGSSLTQTPVQDYFDPPISQTLINKSLLPQTATYNVFARAGSCVSLPFDVVVTVNPVPILSFKDTIVVCSGTPANFNSVPNLPAGTTFSWGAPQITPANSLSGTGINAQTNQAIFTPLLNNLKTTSSIANFTILPNTPQNCPGKPFTVVVSVNPVATITTQKVVSCSGTTFISSPTNVPQNTRYNWNTPSTTTGIYVVNGSQNFNVLGDSTISGNLTYSGVDSGGIATYTITPKSGNCIGSPFNLLLTVRPLPSVSTASKIACSESPFSSSPTSNLTNISTLYTWSLPAVSPLNSILGASANNSPAQSISQSLIDTTSNIAQATYTVTPIALGCNGLPFSFIAIINPIPYFSNKDTVICPNYPFSMNPSPLPFITSYTWDSPVFNIQNAVLGGYSQSTPLPSFSQVLTNTTNSIDVMATYKVTPRYGDCVGKPFSIIVTVKASPYITDTLSSTVCSGNAFSVKMPKNLPLGSMYYWDEPTYSNGITGGSAQTILQTNVSQTLRNINSDTSSGNALYSVTPVANGCKGNSFAVKVLVKANSATLTSPLTLPALCSGSTFNYTPISNFPGTAFSWVRDSMPGLQNQTGSGYSDISEILNDTIGDPLLVKYRFSLMYNGCVNLKTQVVSVIINPKPALGSPLRPTAICSGNTFNYTPVSSTRDATFSWSRSYVAGITEPLTSGDNSVSERLTNTTFNLVQVPYVYTLTANGCNNQQTVYEIVNPVLSLPNMTSPVCSGSNFKIIPPNVVNAEFLWTAPTLANGLTGGIDNNIIPINGIIGTITNLTDTPSIASYIVRPIIPGASSGGCLGNPFKLSVVVNPIPVLSSPSTVAAVCSSTPFSYVPTSKTPGTIFSWTRDSIVGISNKPSKGSYTINETLVDSTVNSVVVTYKFKTTFNGCTDSTQSVTFTVNPAPIVPDQKVTICSGTTFTLPTDLEPLRTTYTWTLPSIVPNNSLTSFTAKSTAQSAIIDSLNNLSLSNATAIYTIKPFNPTCNLQPFNITVTVKPVSIIGDQIVNTCNGQKMVVTPKGTPTGTTYRWAFSDFNPSFALSGYTTNDTLYQPNITQTLLNSSNNIVNANYLITNITNGCIGKPFQLKAIVNPTPIVKITGASSVCANSLDTIGLSFTGTGPWSISYIDNKDNLLTQISGFSSANSFIVQPNLPNSASYIYSIKHVNDAFCSRDTTKANPTLASITQLIRKLPIDTIYAPNGQLICIGQFQPMVISPLAKSYQWYFNDSILLNATSVNFNAYNQGVYSAKVTDDYGCSNMAVNKIKMVDLKTFGIYFTNDSINCINTIKQFLNYSDTSSIRNIKWKWNFNGEDSSTNYNAVTNFKKPGLKKISLSATVPTCTYSITKDSLINISVPIATVNLPVVTTNAGRNTPLNARVFEGRKYKYSWKPTWGLNFTNINNPIFNYSKSQNYYISMTATDGCVTVDTISIKVFDSAIVNIFIPKSFSPNGDGINDVLYPYLAGMKSLTYLKIVNKFGRLMYETKNSTEGWNGISYGEKQPMDAYMWIAEGIDNKGNIVQKTGNVLLIR
jgi:gliding motility-associated-like protein